MTENLLPIESSQFLLYTAESGKVHVEVFLQDETVWLTQKRMAELFGVDVRTVNEHLLNIFKTGELQEDSTIRKIRIVQKEGKRDVERENTFTMEQFAMGVDKFLTFNEYKVLHGKGKVSKAQADVKANKEYEKFNKKQKIESDFDRMVAKIVPKKKKDE